MLIQRTPHGAFPQLHSRAHASRLAVHPSTARGSTRSVTSHGEGVGLGDGARAWRGAARTTVGDTAVRRTLTRPTVDWACNIMTSRWKMRAAWQVSGYINYTYGIAGNVRTPAVASNGTCSLVNSPLEGTRKP